MPGVRALRYIQFGKEATPGTAVAAAQIYRGLGTIEDARETVFAEEDIALLSGTDRTYVPKLEANLTFDDVAATYEQLPVILTGGIKALTTGVADGSGSSVIYTYPFATNAQQTCTTFTIEGGDDQQEEEMEYSFVQSFKMSGKSGEAIMVSADWVGRQVTPSTKTGSLSVPAVDTILFQQAKLYSNAVSSTFGNTQLSSTFLAFELDFTTGLTAVWTGEGNKYFTFTKMAAPEVLLKVTFEHDSSATAEIVAWRAETARALRIAVTGPAVTTAGTAYSAKTMILDVAGKWESFDKIGEQDGNDIRVGTFRGRYNSTIADFGKFVVVNERSTIA